MCGISGAYSHVITATHHSVVDTIIKSQYMRGPDHQAKVQVKYLNAEALLGHNRLSIIDLSEHANQPLFDATHRYCIVYNGEVYNYLELREILIREGYQFRTVSDTEVILNAFIHWGKDALNRFYGPFAFGLFDNHDGSLWICRDRFGVKPLYYLHHQNTLYFASTTNALARQFNLKPNFSYLAKGLQYLVYEDDSEMSAYEGIFSLPAGSYMSCQIDNKDTVKINIHQYYDLNTNVASLVNALPVHQPKEILSTLNERLHDAVNIRLRSDVPLAISLSGGLDSSTVAALVSEKHHHTIGFSFGDPGCKQSEGPLVKQCAEYLGLEMQYIWPTPEEMIAALHETIIAQDAPFASLSVVAQYLLYQKVKSANIKVLLGGQGGDEAFMGYKKFLLFWLRALLNDGKYWTASKNLLQMLPMFFAELGAIRNYWQHKNRYFGKKNHANTDIILPISAPNLALNASHSHLRARQIKDITKFSLPTLLRYEDRNSMGHSIESRLPFLDHRIIELGLALPEAMKIKSGYGKWIIRQLMENKIPDSIRLAQYKRGFDIPMRTLVNKGLGQSIRRALAKNNSVVKDFLPATTNINAVFADDQLLSKRHLMTDAITLLWLKTVL